MGRKQHYVPRMYLKRFQDGDGLCVYDKTESQIRFRQNYEAYAHRNYFYDLPSKDLLPIILEYFPNIDEREAERLSKQQFIENGLCSIEDHANTTLDALACGQSSLTDSDVQIKLISFLQLLSLRTVAQREEIAKIHSITAKWLSEVNIPKEQYGEYLRKVSENTSDKFSKIQQIRNLLDPTICFDFSYMLLDRYNWYMGRVAPESDLSLVTSDNPAGMIAHGANDCCFPISLRKAVIFRAKDNSAPLFVKDMPVGDEIILSQDSVSIYNTLQEQMAQRELYGDRVSIESLKRK